MSPIRMRHRARQVALQALYQWEMAKQSIPEIELQYQTNQNMTKVDVPYFQELLHEVPAKLAELDAQFESYLDRKLTELTPIELQVLRLATYELLYRHDVPYRVVINEALVLTKTFGTEQGYRYVNGVLHHVASQLRPLEVGSD